MKVEWADTDGTVADVREIRDENAIHYCVVFTYKVDGSWYGGTFTTYDALRKGDLIPVRYDPRNPEDNDLVEKEKRRKLMWTAVALAVGLAILYAVLR